MRELPNGTVTLFFTDIEGSTRLLIELGDRYAEVLAHHRRLMREAFATHGGVEVDTQGDAFFVVFARPQDAVAAAADAQGAHAGRPIRVRIGIHTGTPTLTEEGYAGLDVHRAARVMAAGHGGQVLVSQTTCDLLDGTFGMRDLGEHRLKDLTAPQRLYQLLIEGLPVAFPALKTLEGRPTNLPVQPSPLIGREGELAEVCFLLRRNDVRLLTLTGPGGSGKTRLALQAAAELLDEHEGGTFFVGLAPVTEPELVVPTIAQTLGLREWPGRTISETLRDYLERKTVLLLLDNLEQVVDAASAIGDLLASCPKLSILATSREPLRLAAEREYPVDPLSSDDAVALFTERARTAKPHSTSRPRMRPSCGRSAADSTTFRSQSSLQLHASSSFHCRLCATASTSASRFSREARVTLPSASARCARRSIGASGCLRKTNRRSSLASAFSRAASRLRRPRRLPAATWKAPRPSWTRAFCVRRGPCLGAALLPSRDDPGVRVRAPPRARRARPLAGPPRGALRLVGGRGGNSRPRLGAGSVDGPAARRALEPPCRSLPGSRDGGARACHVARRPALGLVGSSGLERGDACLARPGSTSLDSTDACAVRCLDRSRAPRRYGG